MKRSTRALSVPVVLGALVAVGLTVPARAGSAASGHRTLLNTNTGSGPAPHRRLHAGERLVVPVTGHAGVPSTRVSSVRLKVRTSGAAHAGRVRFGAGESRTASVATRAHRAVSTVVRLALGTDGRMVLRNASSGRVDVHVWVVGWTRRPVAPPRDAWTQSGGGPGHSWGNPGAQVDPGSLARSTPRWTAPRRADDQIVVYGKLALVPVYRHQRVGELTGIRALSLATGRSVWTIWNVPVDPGTLAVYGDYLVTGGGRDRSTLTAVDLMTRRVVWRHALTAPRPGVCDTEIYRVSVVSGVVAALSCSAILDAFDLRSGRHLWSRASGWRLLSAAPGRIVAYTPRGVAVLDARTGRILWQPAYGTVTGTVSGERLVFTSYDSVYSYRIAGCGHAVCPPVWTAPTGSGTGRVDGVVPQYTVSISATDDTVAVAESSDTTTRHSGILRLFDGATGAVVGERLFARSDVLPRVLVVGAAVLYGYDDRIYAIATRCGGACRPTTVYGPDRYQSPASETMETIVVVGRTLILTPGSGRLHTTAFTVG